MVLTLGLQSSPGLPNFECEEGQPRVSVDETWLPRMLLINHSLAHAARLNGEFHITVGEDIFDTLAAFFFQAPDRAIGEPGRFTSAVATRLSGCLSGGVEKPDVLVCRLGPPCGSEICSCASRETRKAPERNWKWLRYMLFSIMYTVSSQTAKSFHRNALRRGANT